MPTPSGMPTVAELRAVLKELGQATTSELGGRFALTAHQRYSLSSVLVTLAAREDSWLEVRKEPGSRFNMWAYKSAAERAGVALPPAPPCSRPSAPPPPPPTKPASAGADGVAAGLELLFDQLALKVSMKVSAAVISHVDAHIDRLRLAPSITLAQVKAVIAAEVDGLETRLLQAFGAPTEPATPKPAEVLLPTAAAKLPRVLVYRVDANQGARLLKVYNGLLNLSVHTDMTTGPSAAVKEAQSRWDAIVVNTRVVGHSEVDALSQAGCKLVRVPRTEGLAGVIDALDRLVGLE
jgi:hypothetical protein